MRLHVLSAFILINDLKLKSNKYDVAYDNHLSVIKP